MQIGRRFYLPLRSWRENHEDPAGNFGELNSFDRLVSTGCPNKKYKYKGFGQKFMNSPRQKKRNFFSLAEKNTERKRSLFHLAEFSMISPKSRNYSR